MLDPEGTKGDDRITVVFVGEGGAQNGRMAECLNAAAKEKLPILFIVIDNGRAINTFTPDVAANNDVYLQGMHYGVPGIKVDGGNLEQTLKTGRAVIDYVRKDGPAILQVHTYRFQGHSPADPEHERGRKDEKKWARAEADPIKLFEASELAKGLDLESASKAVKAVVKQSLDFARDSPAPPASLAKELEYPDKPDTDYNTRGVSADAAAITTRTTDPAALAVCEAYVADLQVGLYKILFYFKAFVHGRIILFVPLPICIAHTIAILLHDDCALYDSPPTTLLYAIHHTP